MENLIIAILEIVFLGGVYGALGLVGRAVERYLNSPRKRFKQGYTHLIEPGERL